jgi:hypothetical protein
MRKWIVPGFGGCAAVVVLAVLWQAGAPPAPAQTSAAAASQGESWGSPDGGAVVIKPGGTTYSVLITDVSDNASLFSEGRVVSRSDRPDGSHTYLLKPTTPGQAGWSFEVIAKPDGTAEIWLIKGGQRHLAAPLKK